MARRGENIWQSEKTLAQCMQYMLDNEIATDVCIEVEEPCGEIVTFRAHKYMLIARSPVFEAMFSSGMTECGSGPEAKIRIDDIDADVFKEVLNYIYSESVSIGPDSVELLIYAGTKYMLPKLVGECHKWFSKILSVHNVIDILELSLRLDDQPLKSDCLKLISVNAKAIFTGVDLWFASRQLMEAILDSETIPVRESIIYETAVNWAKHQLERAIPEENPTDLQIREELGDLLYKIRFPAMKQTEFADISAGNNVLTADEKESIYYFFATKRKDRRLRFPTERRITKEFWIDRTVKCAIAYCQRVPSYDGIDFRTDQDILLTGIGLHTAGDQEGYDVNVEILQLDNSLFKKRLVVPYVPIDEFYGASNPFKLVLNEPIVVQAGVLYSVKTLSLGRVRYYGKLCRAVCTEEKVTFTFSRHFQSSATCETRGQIPRLYFRFL